MKHFQTYFGLLVLFCILAACAPQRLYPPEATSQTVSVDDTLYLEGEKLLQQGALDQALARFSRYLAQFPKGQKAGDALSRIGQIFARQGQPDAAQAFYQRVISDYPQSELADTARLAIIDLLIADHRSADAIAMATQMAEAADLKPGLQLQLWRKLAELYQDRGDLAGAALSDYMLYRTVPAVEQGAYAERFKESIARLDGQQIEAIWDRVDDREMRSYLMYRYALVQVAQGNDDDALDILTAFRAAYPQHPYIQEAGKLIDTLTGRLAFAPYTVGCLLPLSGSYKLYGQRALTGVELALSLLQSSEAALPIRLIVKDTASDDRHAVQAVRELAQAHVGAIIGPMVTVQAAAREAQKLQIPIITFTQKPGITAIGDYVFRNFITPQNQVQTLVDYFINEVGLREFAILYPQETYGSTFMTLFWDEVVRQGGKIVGVEAYNADQTDFAVPIKKLIGTYYPIPTDLLARPVVRIEEDPYFEPRTANLNSLEEILPDPVTRLTGLFFEDPDQDRARGPAIGRGRREEEEEGIIDFDVLFIPDSPKMAGLILPQLAYHDIRDIYLAGTNLWHSQQLLTLTRDYAQSAVMVDGFFKKSQSPLVQRFVETYHKIYNADPGIIEAFAFDTAKLLFDIVAQPDLHMRHTLRDAIWHTFNFYGVTGPTSFDENGEAIKRLDLLRVKGGQFVEIARP